MNSEHRSDHCEIAEELHKIRKAIQAGLEWFKSHDSLATKHDLKKMENKIVGTQTEVVAQLQGVQATLNKVATEETDLVKKIAELQALVTSMGDAASPELIAAAQAVSDQAGVLDAIVPDVQPPPGP